MSKGCQVAENCVGSSLHGSLFYYIQVLPQKTARSVLCLFTDKPVLWQLNMCFIFLYHRLKLVLLLLILPLFVWTTHRFERVASIMGDASNLVRMAFLLSALLSLQPGDRNVLPPPEVVAVSLRWGLFGSYRQASPLPIHQSVRVQFLTEKENQLCPERKCLYERKLSNQYWESMNCSHSFS